MNVYFGENIKRLRKSKGITQEVLAEYLGISFQAVSKWERNEGYPDITLIPLIAEYFKVSTDELLGFSLTDIASDIENICKKADKDKESKEGFAAGKKIIEEGLIKYPNNDVLLDKLLYFINYTEEPDKTIEVAYKIIKHTNNYELKYNAYRYLAYAYDAKGNVNKAIECINNIPQLEFTQYSEMAFVSEGKFKYEVATKQKRLSLETLLQMMWKRAEYYESEAKISDAIRETENALKVISVFVNEENASDIQAYAEFFNKQLSRLKV